MSSEPMIRCTGCGQPCRSGLPTEDRLVEIPPGSAQAREAGWWGRRREERTIHVVQCVPCGWSHETPGPWRRA